MQDLEGTSPNNKEEDDSLDSPTKMDTKSLYQDEYADLLL